MGGKLWGVQFKLAEISPDWEGELCRPARLQGFYPTVSKDGYDSESQFVKGMELAPLETRTLVFVWVCDADEI